MADERLRLFKNTGRGDIASLRHMRATVTVELRRQRRDEQLRKHRNVVCRSDLGTEDTDPDINILSMEAILSGLYSLDPSVQLQATQNIRKILSVEENPAIKRIIDAGAVPILVQLLSKEDCPIIQFEAAWALTNIAAGSPEQTRCVVNAGAVLKLVELVSSKHLYICEQAISALGNIAVDGPELRDFVISHKVLKQLVQLICPDSPVSLLRSISWTLANLCRNKNPSPPFELVKKAIPAFAYLIKHSDHDIVEDCCWAFSYLTDGPNKHIQTVTDSGVVPTLVSFLSCNIVNIMIPALRAIGNIVTGTDEQTQLVLDANAIPLLGELLFHSRSIIQKEAAWTLSNIAAGNSRQIQYLIDSDIIKSILMLMNTGDHKTVKETSWVITNLTSGANAGQISKLIEENVLSTLARNIPLHDPMIILVMLDALKNIFLMAVKYGNLKSTIIAMKEQGAIDALESLLLHENPEVYRAASYIVESFVSEDETSEDES